MKTKYFVKINKRKRLKLLLKVIVTAKFFLSKTKYKFQLKKINKITTKNHHNSFQVLCTAYDIPRLKMYVRFFNHENPRFG